MNVGCNKCFFNMKLMKNKIWILLVLVLANVSCHDFPVDEDGLLITTRNECYVSNFDLLDTDNNTVKVGDAYIDTLAQVAIIYVKFATPLDNLWPQVSLCEDAKLNPKITGRVDFTCSKVKIEFIDGDWMSGIAQKQLGERIVSTQNLYPENPVRYTVIAGNRKTKKEYKFFVVERPLQ